MLRPKEMARVLIAGPRDRLSSTIEILHEMKALHVVGHVGEDETFGLGQPLPQASEVSESLVKLRSIASILEIEAKPTLPAAEVGSDAEQRILTLEVNIREEEESRKRIDELLAEQSVRIEALRPFATLELDLASYAGYENLSVFVGRISGDLDGLDEVTERYEAFRTGDVIALFADASQEDEVRQFLLGQGFASLEVPAEEGDPRQLLQTLLEGGEKWRRRLDAVRERLTKLRAKYADFVISAEAFLTVEIEKAEAPLLFAASDHSFVAEGWVPLDRWPEIRDRLGGVEALYVDLQNPPGEADPPVLLDNPKPTRPFEFLTKLFSTPRYGEIDPTLPLFVVFPLFFGFIIGDLGYGSLFILLGLVALWKIRPPSDFRNLMAIIMLGGVFAALFGTFVFGEAFGIPFHAAVETVAGGPQPVSAEGTPLSWASFGINIPIGALVHKLTDVGDMLVLSVIAGAVHLGLGYLIGIVNELPHSRRHAAAKGAWLAVLFGLFVILMYAVRSNRVAGFVWDQVLFFIPRAILDLSGFEIPVASLVLLVVGTAAVVYLEALTKPINIAGFLAPIEIAGLLANIISYTRLAGIAIAKAALAEALMSLVFGSLIFTGQIALVIGGFAALVVAQMLVFFLGGISAGIQALRLNYVEFFSKFYNGNGVPFKPFGAPTVETA
ncbi:MAG: V-type ATP synthase subunit I [Candidatus Thermoplasmatota archaeon]|nr:V-type ATP synthase subunit I [Candidatus Thermoplasmatota archaeon]